MTETGSMSQTAGEASVLLVFAHPALERSRANRVLSKVAEEMDEITFHDLYETYPDYVIDVEAEQARLLAHDVIALQFPMYWYSTPALMKEWLDLVWLHGFAYGKGGDKLKGKRLFVACTTGGPAEAYHQRGYNRFTMEEFLRPLEQTAHLCGMTWENPFVVHGAPLKDEAGLAKKAEFYRQRLLSLTQVPKTPKGRKVKA